MPHYKTEGVRKCKLEPRLWPVPALLQLSFADPDTSYHFPLTYGGCPDLVKTSEVLPLIKKARWKVTWNFQKRGSDSKDGDAMSFLQPIFINIMKHIYLYLFATWFLWTTALLLVRSVPL